LSHLEKVLHQIIESRASANPNETVLIENGSQLTYAQLNQRANYIANKLVELELTNKVVAILLDRSIDMIVSILSVLKAGGIYMSLDPHLPEERIRYMIRDSGASMLLTKTSHKFADIERIELDLLDNRNCYLPDNLNIRRLYDDVAYINYTSGSTGNPKGVQIEHKSLVNLYHSLAPVLGFSEHRKIINISSVSFDLYILETLLPLASGMQVIIIDNDKINYPRLLYSHIFNGQMIDYLQVTPSRLQFFLDDPKGKSIFGNIRNVLIGGEATSVPLLNKLRATSQATIFNLYGPTETTVWSSVKDITHENEVTIGKPIDGNEYYILDENCNIPAELTEGELGISGQGLSRGYVNNSKLTAEKFIPHPYIPNEKIYRTGDYVKKHSNGEYVVVGRIDEQIKIRGYRVEPGEIEHAFAEIPGIIHAAVVPYQDNTGFNNLAAFIKSERKYSNHTLREELAKRLPAYMIPNKIVEVESVPLTNSGKTDRQYLKQQAGKHDEHNNGTNSSREINATELNLVLEAVLNIWATSLGRNRIQKDDRFFDIGGNSLLLTQIMNGLESQFPQLQISMGDLFQLPTPERLAEFITKQLIRRDTN